MLSLTVVALSLAILEAQGQSYYGQPHEGPIAFLPTKATPKPFIQLPAFQPLPRAFPQGQDQNLPLQCLLSQNNFQQMFTLPCLGGTTAKTWVYNSAKKNCTQQTYCNLGNNNLPGSSFGFGSGFPNQIACTATCVPPTTPKGKGTTKTTPKTSTTTAATTTTVAATTQQPATTGTDAPPAEGTTTGAL